MFDHEFSNRNYVLLSQLKSLSDIDPNILNKFKSYLDIDTTSKTIRINIYDVFTLYALLNKEPSNEDINNMLNLHKPFVKNYIDESKLQMEDDYMLYDFLSSLGDTKSDDPKIEGGINQQSISDRLVNNLKQLHDDIKQYGSNLGNKVYGGDNENELNTYKFKAEVIKSNKPIIDDLHDEILKSELNEILGEIEKDYDNINKKIEYYKSQNESLIDNIKTIVYDDLVKDESVIDVEIQRSFEESSLTYIIAGVLLLIILISCIICYRVVTSKHKRTTVKIDNKPKPKKEEEVKPFNLTDEILMKVNDVDVKITDQNDEQTNSRSNPGSNSQSNSQTNSRSNPGSNKRSNSQTNSHKKYVTTELDILKSELNRDVNKILNIEDPNKYDNIEPITIHNTSEPEIKETDDSVQNAISNEILHKLEEHKINNKDEDDMFGNLELF